MRTIIKILILLSVLAVFSINAFADPEDYPEIVEIDNAIYTKVIINGEIYYEKDETYYVFDPETGQMMEAEISFP